MKFIIVFDRLTGQCYYCMHEIWKQENIDMMTTDKRMSILRALEKVLKNRRYDEVTLDKVADAANVGKGTIYRYFQNKEDLFFQMVQDSFREEIDAVQAVAASTIPVREKLNRAAETMSEHIQRHFSTMRIMHEPQFTRRLPGAREMMQKHHKRLNKILLQVLSEAIETELLCDDLNLEHALCLYKGMIMERTMRLIHESREEPVAQLVDLILSGMGRND